MPRKATPGTHECNFDRPVACGTVLLAAAGLGEREERSARDVLSGMDGTDPT